MALHYLTVDNTIYTYTGSVEHPLCDWEVGGSIPAQVKPNTLKIVLAGLSLGTQTVELGIRTGQLSAGIMTGWDIMSSVQGWYFSEAAL